MASAARRAAAILLHASDLGESDRLVTFYTLEYGKVKGVAKGAKRSRKRFLNVLEPFNLIDLIFVSSRSGGLVRIDQADVKRSFPQLVSDVELYGTASLCCELVDLWSREGDPDERVFRLLYALLDLLAGDISPLLACVAFKIQLLILVGYAPRWDLCVSCGTKMGKRVYSAPSAGGFVCPGCADNGATELNLGELRTIQHLSRTRLDLIGRVAAPSGALKKAWLILKLFHIHHLQRTPASYNVLEQQGSLNHA